MSTGPSLWFLSSLPSFNLRHSSGLGFRGPRAFSDVYMRRRVISCVASSPGGGFTWSETAAAHVLVMTHPISSTAWPAVDTQSSNLVRICRESAVPKQRHILVHLSDHTDWAYRIDFLMMNSNSKYPSDVTWNFSFFGSPIAAFSYFEYYSNLAPTDLLVAFQPFTISHEPVRTQLLVRC